MLINKTDQTVVISSGETGEELFRASEFTLRACSGPGDRSAACRSSLPYVRFEANGDAIYAHLKKTGAYRQEDLDEADEQSLQMRLLWEGACTWREQLNQGGFGE